MNNKPSIKIFVSSHKLSEYIENDIFAPVQVGAGIKGRNRIPNFLQDDNGENISEKNPRFCELTAQYWAWKNCDYDYYGFFHYRRYFAFNNKYSKDTSVWGTLEEANLSKAVIEKYDLSENHIQELVQECDIVLPEAKDITLMPNMGKNIREQYCGSGYLHEKDLDIMLDVLKEKYPIYIPYAEKYLSGKKTYLNNMFIMRKDLFNEYNEWLFDILFECDNRIDYTDYSVEAIRTPGHLAERLLNIYIAHLKDHKQLKIRELPTVLLTKTDPFPELKPAFEDNNVAIALAADDYYVPYVATVLTSIKQNSSNENNYDIFVMNKNISPVNQRRLNDIFKDNSNFSLRFVDISRFENEFKHLFLRGHFTIETWFRLFMPKIMPNYEKILYLDSDLVVNHDVAELYKTDVTGVLLAACHDADTAGLYNGFLPDKKHYMDNILKIKEPYNYFQAGVILFNLEEFRKTYSTEEMLKYAGSYQWELLDQDVLNNLAQGRVKFVDMTWNVMFNWRYMRRPEIISRAPKYLSDEYDLAHKNPKIIHYAGPDKPWSDPEVDYAELFWKYAKESGYYESIIMRMQRNLIIHKPSILGRIKSLVKRILVKLLPRKSRIGRLARKTYSKIRK
ncbi:DUF4422 domain-containing protein [Actinomyces sp. zg-332]|uniref:DUF4422 domain-containing protein n=1 Tax=Actinomyces sp. zg-332 TaxID=2708340 RepID=UPI00141D93B9|nr:DUF4422 domain-containing protein [Actinomyces sp. zg-332]QPK94470.1 DUF4422 domain-containing protein [Actinomyces sp. zg-332]